MSNKLIPIGDAAEYIGVSVQTLRRWHNDGTFPATLVSEGGHRYYSLSDLERLSKGIFRIAKEWASAPVPETPDSEFHCRTKDVFKTRLDRMATSFETSRNFKDIGPVVTAIAGEIGNNSFDHNLGNWPDIMGNFFAYDLVKGVLVLADRGQGILKTLGQVRPDLQDHGQALRVAFTEIITGRAPEHRGNGLKFVLAMVTDFGLELSFQSGDAILMAGKKHPDLTISLADDFVPGCLARLKF